MSQPLPLGTKCIALGCENEAPAYTYSNYYVCPLHHIGNLGKRGHEDPCDFESGDPACDYYEIKLGGGR